MGIRQRGRLWHKRALIVSSDLEIVSYFGDVHGHAASRVRLRLRCSELLRCTPVSLDVASRCKSLRRRLGVALARAVRFVETQTLRD